MIIQNNLDKKILVTGGDFWKKEPEFEIEIGSGKMETIKEVIDNAYDLKIVIGD